MVATVVATAATRATGTEREGREEEVAGCGVGRGGVGVMGAELVWKRRKQNTSSGEKGKIQKQSKIVSIQKLSSQLVQGF